MVAAVNAAELNGDGELANTVARLCMAFLKHIPLDAIDYYDVQAHFSHVSPPGATMLERTCAALLAIIPNSKRLASATKNGAALKVCRTLAKQDVYIKEIWNHHHRHSQDPEWLEDNFSKGRKGGYSRGSQHRGTSNYSTASINIIVAKQNITMQAVGIGDCDVSSVDNMGNPCKLVLLRICWVFCMFPWLVRISCLHTVLVKKDIR